MLGSSQSGALQAAPNHGAGAALQPTVSQLPRHFDQRASRRRAPPPARSAVQSCTVLPTQWSAPSTASAALQQAPASRAASGRSRGREPLTQALFTGIVQGTATVSEVVEREGFRRLRVAFPAGAVDGVQIGASVALNGTCLTVTDIHSGSMLSFDVIAETLRATNLGTLAANSSINFERSARVGDEIGGHHVSGHVHTTAELASVQQSPDNLRLAFRVPRQWMKYILPKGFIALNGCSLTVGEVGADEFSVYLIPETLRVTVLGQLAVGDPANVEIDSQTQVIVDTVETVVGRYMADRQRQSHSAAHPAAAAAQALVLQAA